MKIVDEIEDVNLLNLQNYKEYFQTLCTLFISLWMYNEPYISASWILFIIPASYSINQIDSNYWKSLIPIPFITLLLKMNTLDIEFSDLLQKIAYIILASLFIILEDKLTPEEHSYRKILFRILAICISLIVIYASYNLSSAAFIQSCSLFIIGYCFVSIISKLFFTKSQTAALDKS
jgi:hypothetical protein